ncbi:acyl carrier protein [Micromonospora sp. NPDC005215]|uniref:acyl carrier protein n=1 Tax=Micromonospora sp. NPDC005215 TaxID=3157024 RepID=UPI0033B82A5E
MSSDTALPDTAAVIEWLRERLAAPLRMRPEQINPSTPFAEYGLDSIGAMSVSVEVEDHFGVVLEASDLWDNPTVASLGALVSQRLSTGTGSLAG